ncbi:MAG TPA: SGNH/GDSL hydrolase family protein [Candidatus Dormibacteraeota bacterium]
MLALLGAAALLALGAVPASAAEGGQGLSYLALGDSVPFGFNPLVDASNVGNFTGYPEIVAKALSLEDVNATCPGEATGGFLSLTGTDNVCRPYRAAFPLHVSYSGTQMDFALNYLATHKHTRLVTLTLGANDYFRFLKDCAVGPTFGTCALGFGGMLALTQANLSTIFARIRAAGYDGTLIGVTYYALNYVTGAAGTLALDAPMVAAVTGAGGLVASGFDAWEASAFQRGAGDSCAAGLLIALPAGGCDVHPTPLGRDLLAQKVLDTIAASCSFKSARRCLKTD